MALKSVGANLRDAREKLGFSLDDIGVRTRITEKCLTAIERDDVSKLSSPFFYKSFVRQYAEQVGLEYDLLASGVDRLAGTMREPDLPGQGEYPPVRVAPIQPRVKRDNTWALPAMVLLGAAVGFSGYAAWRYQPVWLTDTAVGTFVRNLKSAQAPAVTSTSEIPREVKKTDDATEAPAAKTLALPSEHLETEATTEPAQKSDSVTAVIVPEPPPAADGAIHLELAATERTWLSVVADGKPAYSGIMEKEQVKVLDGQESAELRTGNAAGVSITFNGRQIGAIGPRGTTRKVVFTKTGFEVFPQAPPQYARGTRIGG